MTGAAGTAGAVPVGWSIPPRNIGVADETVDAFIAALARAFMAAAAADADNVLVVAMVAARVLAYIQDM